MTALLSLKDTRSVRASELKNLDDYIGREFILKKPHTNRITVKLEKVKRRDVRLAYTEGRVDTYSISIAEFNKFYELVSAE